jgi:hypothetical protein
VPLFLLCWGLVLAASLPLSQRWREEAHDRRVAVAVDWNEYRDLNARLAPAPEKLWSDLKAHGVTALVMTPLTLNDLLAQRRVQAGNATRGSDPLDVTTLRTTDLALAQQIVTQAANHSVEGLTSTRQGSDAVISRPAGFAALKDIDLGFDSALIATIRTAGFTPVLRIYGDSWFQGARLPDWLKGLPDTQPRLGVLFSTDDLPAGLSYGGFWRAWIARNHVTQFLPEFKPSQAAWLMAFAMPSYAFRVHSIPASELKDLRPGQELSRWHRAVVERSCRLLIVRTAPADNRDSFLTMLSTLTDLLKRHQWQAGFPGPRMTWRLPEHLENTARTLGAFAMVCLVPWFALRAGLSALPRWRTAFGVIAVTSLLGALTAAAIAQTPFTRVEIIPFRGVKWAFILSWATVFLGLYSIRELKDLLSTNVRRWDLAMGGVLLAAIGYLLLRSGNAPAAWKPGWEQGFRDLLESALVARPRFKEFAIGHPLLWIGCYIAGLHRQRLSRWDGRLLIGLGMIGPISMINTFCHLHSPLALELLRSMNGLVLGVILGTISILILRPWLRTPPRFPIPAAKPDAWAYQRTS